MRCEGGRVTVTGNAPHKRIKHDVGELAWAIPAINDVQNTITITGRRRSRAFGRDAEPQGERNRESSRRDEGLWAFGSWFMRANHASLKPNPGPRAQSPEPKASR